MCRLRNDTMLDLIDENLRMRKDDGEGEGADETLKLEGSGDVPSAE